MREKGNGRTVRITGQKSLKPTLIYLLEASRGSKARRAGIASGIEYAGR
jgi:hypothetical protein